MDLYMYSVKISISVHKILIIKSFSLDQAEETLKEYYHRKFHDVQSNINNYRVISLGKFNPESQYFDLASEAIEYSEIYS
jgi:hypothetical protein